jgi:hypothetical protein
MKVVSTFLLLSVTLNCFGSEAAEVKVLPNEAIKKQLMAALFEDHDLQKARELVLAHPEAAGFDDAEEGMPEIFNWLRAGIVDAQQQQQLTFPNILNPAVHKLFQQECSKEHNYRRFMAFLLIKFGFQEKNFHRIFSAFDALMATPDGEYHWRKVRSIFEDFRAWRAGLNTKFAKEYRDILSEEKTAVSI